MKAMSLSGTEREVRKGGVKILVISGEIRRSLLTVRKGKEGLKRERRRKRIRSL